MSVGFKLDPELLALWGDRLTVIADILLVLAGEGEVAKIMRESAGPSPVIPPATQLDLLSNMTTLVGDSLTLGAAEEASTVPPGQARPDLALITLAGSWLVLVSSIIGVLAAQAALTEALSGTGS